LENIRPGIEWSGLARRFFSPAEVSSLNALPAELQVDAFFHCWTRKEAYIKALGEGLNVPLDSFDVSLNPREPAALLRGTNGRWSLRTLEPAAEYVGALAVGGRDWSLRLWHWQAAERRK
jgi:4'-phosphopantetheinyl transferase